MAAAAQIQMYMHDVEAKQQATPAGACSKTLLTPAEHHDKIIHPPQAKTSHSTWSQHPTHSGMLVQDRHDATP
jgi:hypothetical protein